MNKKLGIALFIVALSIGFGSIIYKYYLRSLPQKYTIGLVTKKGKSTSGGNFVEYIYTINNKQYSSTINIGEGYKTINKGDRYLVMIPENHEQHGLMAFDCVILVGAEAPVEGWSQRPDVCKR